MTGWLNNNCAACLQYCAHQQTFKSSVKFLYLSEKPSYTRWASAISHHFSSWSRTFSFSWFLSNSISSAWNCFRWKEGSWWSWTFGTSSATSHSALVNHTWTSSTRCWYFKEIFERSVSSFNAASMFRLNESNHSDILALSASSRATESVVTYWHSFWLNSDMRSRSRWPVLRSSTNSCGTSVKNIMHTSTVHSSE